jgi:HEAT repeat protein
MKSTLPVIVGLLLIPVLGFSQAADASANKTIEEKKLQSSVEVQVLSSLAAEPSRPEKLQALDFIEKMVNDKKVSDQSADVIGLLNQLGTEGTANQVYENGRIINDFPDVRRKSAELLGRIGGDAARDALLTIAQKDKEPMVMAEAVYALGTIGSADEAQRNHIALVIAHIITVQDAVNPDNSLALSAVNAFQALGKNANGKVDPEVFSALVRIQNGNYVRFVRDQAKQVINGYTNF